MPEIRRAEGLPLKIFFKKVKIWVILRLTNGAVFYIVISIIRIIVE